MSTASRCMVATPCITPGAWWPRPAMPARLMGPPLPGAGPRPDGRPAALMATACSMPAAWWPHPAMPARLMGPPLPGTGPRPDGGHGLPVHQGRPGGMEAGEMVATPCIMATACPCIRVCRRAGWKRARVEHGHGVQHGHALPCLPGSWGHRFPVQARRSDGHGKAAAWPPHGRRMAAAWPPRASGQARRDGSGGDSGHALHHGHGFPVQARALMAGPPL